MKTIAEKFAGTNARYTPPKCYEENDNYGGGGVCTHAPSFHEPSGISGGWNVPWLGLVSRRDGRLVFKAEDYTKHRAIPPRTRENIAACAAVGLSYWSEAPGAHLWAIGDHQDAHEIHIDRKNGKVQGLLGQWEAFVAPVTLEQTLELF